MFKKVVYASSSSVYGDTPSLPKMEDIPVDGHQRCWGFLMRESAAQGLI